MFTFKSEHSVIQLVNTAVHVVGDVILLRKKSKTNSNMLDFWLQCHGASQMLLSFNDVTLFVHSSFMMLIIGPDTGSLSATTKYFKKRHEIV